MSRSRILSAVAAASIGIALLGACSTESLQERAVGFGLEQAIEGDQDIDLDFSGDGTGGFSISTEEGDFALNFDEDNGGIVFNTDDGDGAISFDEDGIVFNTDDGDGAISFDEDGIVFNTDEGDGVISFDEEGGVLFQSDDGTSGVFGSNAVPASWPAELPYPATADPAGIFFSVFDLGAQTTTSATFEHSPEENYAASTRAILEATGWTIAIESGDASGAGFVQFTRGDDSANVTTDGTGFTSVTFTVANQ